MESKKFQLMRGVAFTLLSLIAAPFVGVPTASAQLITNDQPVIVATPPAVKPPVSPLDVLEWDAIIKEQSPVQGQATADFIFKVSNPSDSVVVIDHVQTSCGCTVAKLPENPWHLAPHTNGIISVSVNLSGKSGTFTKTITVFSTNQGFYKPLIIKVNMPQPPEAARMKNMVAAKTDPQVIFRGDCAICHVDKAKDKMGKDLYVTACGICHEAQQRATMVPDLHNLRHPTDLAFWKQIITYGKPNTMMPGFSDQHGGFLTEKQIDSLAKTLNKAFPSVTVTPYTGKLGMMPPPPVPATTPAPPAAPKN